MSNTKAGIGVAAVLVLGALALVALAGAAAPQVVVPRPEETRFQLISSEPIAGPDGRSHVPGWSVLVFRDRKTDRCHLAFKREEAISVDSGGPCPR
jgi:hypothetical protein